MAQVTVGCKLPNGIIIQHGGKRATIKGANAALLIGGHGITEGVDKELFDAWMKAYADYAPVKAGLIFAHDNAKSTAAEAKEKADNKSGFEQIDPTDKSDKRGAGVEPITKE